jgi:hypothetical protein
MRAICPSGKIQSNEPSSVRIEYEGEKTGDTPIIQQEASVCCSQRPMSAKKQELPRLNLSSGSRFSIEDIDQTNDEFSCLSQLPGKGEQNEDCSKIGEILKFMDVEDLTHSLISNLPCIKSCIKIRTLKPLIKGKYSPLVSGENTPVSSGTNKETKTGVSSSSGLNEADQKTDTSFYYTLPPLKDQVV